MTYEVLHPFQVRIDQLKKGISPCLFSVTSHSLNPVKFVASSNAFPQSLVSQRVLVFLDLPLHFIERPFYRYSQVMIFLFGSDGLAWHIQRQCDVIELSCGVSLNERLQKYRFGPKGLHLGFELTEPVSYQTLRLPIRLERFEFLAVPHTMLDGRST
jgi:hypothetical protein